MSKLKPTILVVDDELGIREAFVFLLEDEYNVLTSENGEETLKLVREKDINLVILDIILPGIDGVEVLRRIKKMDEDIGVVMLTATKTVKTAVEAMKLGAYDYITKPFDIEEIKAVIKKALKNKALSREVSYLRSEVEKELNFESIVGNTPPMKKVYKTVEEVSKSDATVLIYGQSGTGKELIARAIHRSSPRRNKPFIPVNCAAIPPELLESELFGHEKGAFTGAIERRLGKFELANEGTIFFDEVGNLKIELQAKLLRVLEEREIERVGGVKRIRIDVRIISATNIDLKKAVEEGGFRGDLYYRLNVVPLELPPLKERKEDIPLLVNYFFKKFNQKFRKEVKEISPKTLNFLCRYSWPGNVRELENVVERLVALAKKGKIAPRELPLDILMSESISPDSLREEGISLKQGRTQFEKEFIEKVLEKTGWNQTKTAEILGVHRNTLVLKIESLGIKKL
jgi:DNA-binding NtrC family response regulator